MQCKKSQSGFTLIEMIVSLAVFSVVVTISVGALLILIASNRQLQEEQSVLSNLAFAMDSMTRDIRTGSQYYCHSEGAGGSGDPIDDMTTLLVNTEVKDCPAGKEDEDHVYQGLAFNEGGESITGTTDSRIIFYFDALENKIYRWINKDASSGDPESLVSDGIFIINAEFFVTGSAPLPDTTQAAVTIIIEASVDDPDLVPDTKRYFLQTTVVQRTLDI